MSRPFIGIMATVGLASGCGLKLMFPSSSELSLVRLLSCFSLLCGEVMTSRLGLFVVASGSPIFGIMLKC